MSAIERQLKHSRDPAQKLNYFSMKVHHHRLDYDDDDDPSALSESLVYKCFQYLRSKWDNLNPTCLLNKANRKQQWAKSEYKRKKLNFLECCRLNATSPNPSVDGSGDEKRKRPKWHSELSEIHLGLCRRLTATIKMNHFIIIISCHLSERVN